MTLSVYCKFCNWNKPSFIDLFLQTFFTGFCITRKPIKCRKCKQIFYIKKCEKNVALGVCSCIVVTLIPEFSNFLHFLKIEVTGEMIYVLIFLIYICFLYFIMEVIKDILLIKFGEFIKD